METDSDGHDSLDMDDFNNEEKDSEFEGTESVETSVIEETTGQRRSRRLQGLRPELELYHMNEIFAKVFFCADSTIRIPKNYEQAMRSPQLDNWLEAMKVEFDCLVKNKTWDIVDRSDGVPVIGCRWVFDLKFNVDGSIKRFKARLVAQGFSQC